MGWVVCSDAVVESCDAVLIIVVTASRCICEAVVSHCIEILEQCWCRKRYLKKKDEKRSQNDKTRHRMEKHGKDKAQSQQSKSKPTMKNT
ncbi:hypothetical protein Tco_0009763 [Tanacetum coccineum]